MPRHKGYSRIRTRSIRQSQPVCQQNRKVWSLRFLKAVVEGTHSVAVQVDSHVMKPDRLKRPGYLTAHLGRHCPRQLLASNFDPSNFAVAANTHLTKPRRFERVLGAVDHGKLLDRHDLTVGNAGREAC